MNRIMFFPFLGLLNQWGIPCGLRHNSPVSKPFRGEPTGKKRLQQGVLEGRKEGATQSRPLSRL